MSALSAQPTDHLDPSDYPDAEPRPLAVGDVVHFLAAVAVNDNPRFGSAGKMMAYGSEYTITEGFIQCNPPEQRGSIFELIDDEPGQLGRYGRIVVRRGPWPEDELRTEAGSPERAFQLARAESRVWAKHGDDYAAARAELALVHELFGPPEPTNRSTPTVGMR